MPIEGKRQPAERAALALWLLMQQPHYARSLVPYLGIGRDAVEALLEKISRVVPIYCTDDGEWMVLE